MDIDVVEVLETELDFVKRRREKIEFVRNERLESGTLVKREGVKETAYHLYSVDPNGKRRSRKIGGERNAEVIARKQEKFTGELTRTLERDDRALERALKILRRDFRPYDTESIEDRIGESYVDNTGLVNKCPGIVTNDSWKIPINADRGIAPPEKPHYAMDGQICRSKSEVVVYNMLLTMGIPFNYEEPIKLKKEMGNELPFYADFVVHKDDGSILVIEVMGMLSEQGYFENATRKMRMYVLNGYVLGKDLLIIADKDDGTIDSYTVRKILEKYLF